MNTPTPITEAHKRLWTQLYNLAFNEIVDHSSSDGPAHQLIADSEARAVATITAERDQLRAALAKERARLDAGTILLTVAGERVWVCGVDLRAAIDAAMKEDAK